MAGEFSIGGSFSKPSTSLSFGLNPDFGMPTVSDGIPNTPSSGFADFGNWAAGAQALGSLIQGWGGLKAASAAKEQNRIAEMFGRANYDVQAKSFNERLETRARSRRNRESFDDGGKSIANVLSQYGARTLEGDAVVGQDNTNTQVTQESNVSPTAGLPTSKTRPTLT